MPLGLNNAVEMRFGGAGETPVPPKAKRLKFHLPE